MKKFAVVAVLAGSCLALSERPLGGSDHADPIPLGTALSRNLAPGLTGLFLFPVEGDRLVVVFNTHRALRAAPPYDLGGYEFAIHFDLHSEVGFADEADRLRYGGTIVDPTGLAADATIRMRLTDQGTFDGDPVIEGLDRPERILTFAGVRDDPFIFPRFFERNVISMVFSIPTDAFPAGRQELVVWGAVTGEGWFGRRKLFDHVGRSNRSQQARFELLNTLPPSEHVPALADRQQNPPWLLRQLLRLMPVRGLYQYLFEIRQYDVQPDVLIYSTRYPAGFPNGRLLTDDVALLTCLYGDCILHDLSYIEGHDFPRRTTNDKEFLPEFPYLAEPWPAQ